MIHHARRLGIAIAADLLAQRVGVPVGLGASAAWAAQFGAETAIGGALEAVSGRLGDGVVLEGRKRSSTAYDVHRVGQAKAVRHQFTREDLDASPFWREVYEQLRAGALSEVSPVLHITAVTGPPQDWRFIQKGLVRSDMRMDSDRWTDVPCQALLAAATATNMRVIMTGQPDFAGFVHRSGNYTRLSVPAVGRDGHVSHIASACITENPVTFLNRLGVVGMRKPEVRFGLADVQPLEDRLVGNALNGHVLGAVPQAYGMICVGEGLEGGGERHHGEA